MNPLEQLFEEIEYYEERVNNFKSQLGKGQYYVDAYNRNLEELNYYKGLLDRYEKGITGAPL